MNDQRQRHETDPAERPTQPPPSVDEWLAKYPAGSSLRTPEARALLLRLGVAR